MLHVKDLRSLQTQIDKAIIAMQVSGLALPTRR